MKKGRGGEGKKRVGRGGEGRNREGREGVSPRATKIPTNLDITKYVGIRDLRVSNIQSERLVMYVRSWFAKRGVLLEMV